MSELRNAVQPLLDTYQQVIDHAILNWERVENAALECLVQFEDLETPVTLPQP